jgi:hypothetical protein
MDTNAMSLRAGVIELTMPALRMHESYAHQLVHDLDESMMDESPGPGCENTPRFTLGHLCIASALTVWVLKHPEDDGPEIELDVPPAYEQRFRRTGPGDRRLPDGSPGSPTRDELLRELRRQHDRIERRLYETPEEVFAQTMTWKLSHHLPRIADVVMFQCLHEMLHLGQLASWRRAKGLPAAMARMAELHI